MSIATSTAIGIAGAVGAAGAFGGAALSSGASKHAADTQAAAANQAAELQHEDAMAALDWQKQVFGIQTNLAMPAINTGRNSLAMLNQLMGLPSSANVPTSTANFPGAVPGPGQFNPGQFNPAMTPVSSINGGLPGFNPNQFNSGFNPGQFNRLRAMSLRGGMDGGPAPLQDGGFGGPDAGFAGKPNLGLGPDANLALPTDTGGFFNPAPAGGPVQMNGSPGMATATAPGAAPGDPNAYLQPFSNFNEKFQAPTDITMKNDPGFLARLKFGQQAVENSAAARGTLLTGGTEKDLTQFGQDYASNEFSNIYNRAASEYERRYNIFQQQQGTQFNRLAALAGFGQTGVGQLNSAGTAAAGNAGNILLSSGAQIGQNLNNAAAARASGYVGGANAYSSAFNNLGNLAMMYGLFRPGGGGGAASGIPDTTNLGAAFG